MAQSNQQRGPSGHRVGEWHQRAKLSSAQVEEMRHLRQRHGMSYKALSIRFGCGVSTARDIVNYWTRVADQMTVK